MIKKNILQYLLVKDFLKSVGGEESLILVEHCLKKRKSVTDEFLAKKMDLKVTEIRTILNRLHYRGISNYSKTKNTKTGWYSYTWEIKTPRIAELIIEQEAGKIDEMEKNQEFEKDYMFFGCKKVCDLLPFEVAAEYEFKCPGCGKNLESINNEKRIKKTEKKIQTMKDEMEELRKIM